MGESIIRRAGAKLLKLISRAADPGLTANQVQVYGKPDAGVVQLFAQVSDGTVYQLTPSGGGSSIDVKFNFTPLGSFNTLNFTNPGVIVIDSGGGEAEIQIPGIFFLDDGVAVPGPPHFVADFTGGGVTATNPAPDVVEINVPGNAAYLPEQWTQTILPSQTNFDLATKVSVIYATFKAVRDGSIVGLATRLPAAMTVGTLTVNVTVNGAPVAVSITHTSVSNASGGIDTEVVGVVTYAAGDLIGACYTTDAGFLAPIAQVDAVISVFEPTV